MAVSKKQKTELLRTVELFAGLPGPALGALADRLSEIAFPTGRYIVRQGQIGMGFYLIQSGWVRVVRRNRVLAHLGPGNFFGELSLLDQSPRMAHVVADEQAVCLALHSWEFTKLLERHPKIALGILHEVTRRLRAATDLHLH